MNVILDVPMPSVNYTPPNDAILSILQSNMELHWGTICENFLGMVGKDTFWIEFRWFQMWTNYRTMDMARIPHAMFDRHTILEQLRQAIRSGYHILLNVDTFYIQNYVNYQRNHQWHDLFVLGFDEDAQVFHCRDYYNYQHYIQAAIPYQQLADSYILYGFDRDYLNGILLLQQKRGHHMVLLPFHWERLYDGLHTLVAPPKLDINDKQWCGFQYFSHIKAAFQNSPQTLGLRPVHFLIAHIQIMKLRLQLLSAHYAFIPHSLLEESSLLLKKAQQVEALFIKSCLLEPASTQHVRLIASILSLLEEIENRYNTFVWSFMHIIE